MSDEEDFAVVNKALVEYRDTIVHETIEGLIRRVNFFHISLGTQRGCAIDIRKLEILTNILVNKIKSVGMDQTIDIDETI